MQSLAGEPSWSMFFLVFRWVDSEQVIRAAWISLCWFSGLCWIIWSFYQVKLREMKPGQLSQELKEALGMPDGAPPPWLINMQVRGVAFLSCGLSKYFWSFFLSCFCSSEHLHENICYWLWMPFYCRDTDLPLPIPTSRFLDWMHPYQRVLLSGIMQEVGASPPSMRYSSDHLKYVRSHGQYLYCLNQSLWSIIFFITWYFISDCLDSC